MHTPFVEYQKGRTLEVVPVGRAGIDLNTQTLNVPFKDNRLYAKTVGGSPANIAQGAARLGVRTGFIGKVSGNGMGEYIKEVFEQTGVDTGHLLFDQTGAPNCLAITEILAPDNSGSYMYRNGTADTLLTAEEIREDYIADAAAVVVSGTAMSIEPTRTAMRRVVELAKRHQTLVIADVDFRPYGWKSPEETAQVYTEILSQCDIIIGNREEFNAVEYLSMPDNRDNEVSARNFLAQGAKLVIVKDGSRGSVGYLPDQEPVHCPIIKVAAKKTFGSGDAYAAGLLYGLFRDMDLEQAMRFGSACAAITLTGMGCGEAMPDLAQAEQFLREHTFEEVVM